MQCLPQAGWVKGNGSAVAGSEPTFVLAGCEVLSEEDLAKKAFGSDLYATIVGEEELRAPGQALHDLLSDRVGLRLRPVAEWSPTPAGRAAYGVDPLAVVQTPADDKENVAGDSIASSTRCAMPGAGVNVAHRCPMHPSAESGASAFAASATHAVSEASSRMFCVNLTSACHSVRRYQAAR